jgi:hypothetical protein
MTTTEHPTRGPVYVVPCGTEKLDHPAPARELYTAEHFQLVLATAERMAAADGGRVLILSARYGLVELDEVLAPYSQRMDRAGHITTAELTSSAIAAGIEDVEVYGLLPRAYREALELALLPLYTFVTDVYETATRGIGDQRHATTTCRDFYAA